MAKTEIILGEIGGGDLSCVSTDFTSQSSVSINCNVGDIVVVSCSRSANSGMKWNGTATYSSSDCIAYKSYNSNTEWIYYFKASQGSNTYSIDSGTITGQYAVITN